MGSASVSSTRYVRRNGYPTKHLKTTGMDIAEIARLCAHGSSKVGATTMDARNGLLLTPLRVEAYCALTKTIR